MAASVSPIYCPLIQRMINLTVNASDQRSQITSLNVFTISLHGMFSTFGIVENLFILGVVGLQVRLSVISVWILNLAASDLLATASLPFFTLYMARGNTWTLGPTVCRIHSSVFFLNMFVSGFLLAAISLDRCLVVLRPVWAQNHRSVWLAGVICGVIWVTALTCTIPFYVFRDTIPQLGGKILCYYNYARVPPGEPFNLDSLCKHRQEALAVFKFLLAFLMPLLVIIFSYASVNTRLARRGWRRPFRFARLVVAVVVSFVLCWAPYHFFSMLEVLVDHRHPALPLARKALPIVTSLSFLNSVLNPVLYVFSCPDLCKKIRRSLGAVMEGVLAEDLAELARRRRTAQISVSGSEAMMMKRSSIPRQHLQAGGTGGGPAEPDARPELNEL